MTQTPAAPAAPLTAPAAPAAPLGQPAQAPAAPHAVVQAAAAPVPDPPASTSLQLKPGSVPTPVQGAAITATAWTGQLLVGPSEHADRKVAYELVSSLSALDMVLMQEAQDSGKFRELIEAIKHLVPFHQRDALVAQMLTEPADYRDRMTLDDCMEVLASGLEQIAARPTNK